MHHRKTILLVEDNPDDVDLTLRAFTDAKLQNDVVVAEDGAEAVQKPVNFVEFIEAARHLGLYWLLFEQTAPSP